MLRKCLFQMYETKNYFQKNRSVKKWKSTKEENKWQYYNSNCAWKAAGWRCTLFALYLFEIQAGQQTSVDQNGFEWSLFSASRMLCCSFLKNTACTADVSYTIQHTHRTARYPLTHISMNHLKGVASIFPPMIITISSVSLMSGSQPRLPPGELSNMKPKSGNTVHDQIEQTMNIVNLTLLSVPTLPKSFQGRSC